jgi:chromosomal replication initiator protein
METELIMSKLNLLCESDAVFDISVLLKQKLIAKFGEATYRSWLSKLNLQPLVGRSAHMTSPTRFIRDWINTNYASDILKILKEIDDQIVDLDITVSAISNNNHSVDNDEIKNLAALCVKPKQDIQENSYSNNNDIFVATLDSRFTFDNFVVGRPNELAHAAARAVAESTQVQSESNPLFLYGGVGLGKTHLMHAIAWHIRQNNPSRKVIYMSAEKFMYQFVRALRNKEIMLFKEQFRSVDVLMIDDVQFICGKDSTQEEFFHTFNALIDNNRQMVISCDRSPSNLDGMEDRIKSRLGWGLVADVHSTNYELRLGILQSKLEQMKVDVPIRVMEFLASKITSNVRELEGALNKVVAHSKLIGSDINLALTQDILKDLLRSNERIVTIEEIQKKISEHYNVRQADMTSARRLRAVARPRQIAMYIAKVLTPRSLTEIGRKFGGKDHTTVMHAIKKVEQLCKIDNELFEDIKLLTRSLQN